MAIFELRTYSVVTGKMGDVVKLYKAAGYPALEAGGFSKHLVSYFTGDIGAMNQLIHIWKFDDDNQRREFWKSLFADADFMAFAGQLRPMLNAQENKLMLSAPWGPQL